MYIDNFVSSKIHFKNARLIFTNNYVLKVQTVFFFGAITHIFITHYTKYFASICFS